MVGRELALPGVAVDQTPSDPLAQRLGDVDEIDAHAAVLVEVATPVVPVGEQLVLVVQGAEAVDEAPIAQPGDGGSLGLGDVASPSYGSTSSVPSNPDVTSPTPTRDRIATPFQRPGPWCTES